MKCFKINTAKKRFAFEIIVLSIVSLSYGLIYLIQEYSSQKNEKYIHNSKIFSLNENYFKKTYVYLEIRSEIKAYSYESYKRNILNDKDSTFRRYLYEKLSEEDRTFRNDLSFNEFINKFEYDSINTIDLQISILEKKIDELDEQIEKSDKNYNSLFFIIIIFAYPMRYAFYLIKWAIKTLEIKEIKKDNISNQETIVLTDNDKFINKSTRYTDADITIQNDPKNSEPLNKSPFPIWLSFSKEHITGSKYLLRMIAGTFLILFFGIGLYFMFITAYKRSNSLGLNKNNSILVSIIVTLLILICSVMRATVLSIDNYLNNTDQYYQFLALTFLLLIPHFILIFKNGNTESIKSGAKI